MLVSIQCDKFKTAEPIVFHRGLNTIVGDGNNSIGKSTLLMIIDYCFGGDDYFLKEKNILEAIGPHDIKFVFEFGGQNKYFIRNSHEKNVVKVCDSNFQPVSQITIEAFRAGLCAYYGLQNSGLSLRSYISPYFRIYNRGTHNELKPLNATVREADENGVICLLKMYGLYERVKFVNEQYLECLAAKNTLSNLFRTDVAPVAKDQKEVDALLLEIDELEKELARIKTDNATDTGEITIMDEARATELREAKRKLERERKALKRQLSDIEFDDGYYDEDFQRKFIKLRNFFPGVNLQEIKSIEQFHIAVSEGLQSEVKTSNERIRQMIAIIDAQIEEILAKLKDIGVGVKPTVPEAILVRYNEVSTAIENKKKAIENFKKLEEAKNRLNGTKADRDASVRRILDDLSARINESLSTLNDSIRSDLELYPPTITLHSFESYSFQITNDTGTGSRFKSVCMLDITLLQQTDLPAIAHDSIMFSNINDEACVDIFKQYALLTDKQIFVGVDKLGKFADGENPNLAWESRVFELSIGEGTLFGKQINQRKID